MQTDGGRQAGNVIAFIVVGVALAALLAVGIYVSKQQGRVASRTDTVQVGTNDASTKTDTGTNKNPASPQGGTDNKPSASETPTNSEQGATDTQGAGTNNSAATPQSQVPHTGPSSIASTGPADGIVAAVALGFVTVGVFSYLRSQRALRSSALR